MKHYNSRSNTKYNFIFERTSVVKNHDIRILEEIDIGGGKGKISARACLQESEVKIKQSILLFYNLRVDRKSISSKSNWSLFVDGD